MSYFLTGLDHFHKGKAKKSTMGRGKCCFSSVSGSCSAGESLVSAHWSVVSSQPPFQLLKVAAKGWTKALVQRHEDDALGTAEGACSSNICLNGKNGCGGRAQKLVHQNCWRRVRFLPVALFFLMMFMDTSQNCPCLLSLILQLAVKGVT